MRDKLFAAAVILAAIFVVGCVVYGMRLFNATATPITVHEVEPGVRCATMVTADGAAISCWQVRAGGDRAG